ncbi:MAG TPA: hypothetical protein VFU47_13405 [Armatimonadota bacterium]|nr:hypothetical protein [Armatimonadota bacterium]
MSAPITVDQWIDWDTSPLDEQARQLHAAILPLLDRQHSIRDTVRLLAHLVEATAVCAADANGMPPEDLWPRALEQSQFHSRMLQEEPGGVQLLTLAMLLTQFVFRLDVATGRVVPNAAPESYHPYHPGTARLLADLARRSGKLPQGSTMRLKDAPADVREAALRQCPHLTDEDPIEVLELTVEGDLFAQLLQGRQPEE